VPATTSSNSLALHDALPICQSSKSPGSSLGEFPGDALSKRAFPGAGEESRGIPENRLGSQRGRREPLPSEGQGSSGIPRDSSPADRKSTRLNSSHVKSSYAG